MCWHSGGVPRDHAVDTVARPYVSMMRIREAANSDNYFLHTKSNHWPEYVANNRWRMLKHHLLMLHILVYVTYCNHQYTYVYCQSVHIYTMKVRQRHPLLREISRDYEECDM